MKLKSQWLGVVLLTVLSGTAPADDSAKTRVKDPIQSLLFPPELLIQHREDIGLSDEQIQQIRAQVEEAGPSAHEHETQLHEATGRLAELLSAEEVNETAALQQLDDVLAAEQDLKQLHLRLLIRIRNGLTSEQRDRAAEISQAAATAEELQQRLQAKVSRIEREVRTRAENGQPPFEIVEQMQEFPKLMEDGNVSEAEALLDRVIRMLGLDQE